MKNLPGTSFPGFFMEGLPAYFREGKIIELSTISNNILQDFFVYINVIRIHYQIQCMEKFYTENALIRYIYKESDLFEKLEVEHAIETEPEIRDIYIDLCILFNELPDVTFVPSTKTVENILALSRDLSFQA